MCVYLNPCICHAIDLYVCGCVTSIEPKLSGITLHICEPLYPIVDIVAGSAGVVNLL